MNCSPPSALEQLAASLEQGLRQELCLTPKPGLVDRIDNGSHPDLSFALMDESIELVGDYYRQTAQALQNGATFAHLVELGRQAETRMFATLGTNTHKGAIFLGGLLLCARARIDGDAVEPLRASVRLLARELFPGERDDSSHGARARQAHRVSGIIGESLDGLPSLFICAHPSLLQGLDLFGDQDLAAFYAMAKLMRNLEDTTALHRCGAAGLERLRSDGRQIELQLLCGKDPRPLLLNLNATYRQMHLTMGGVADLLGITFGYSRYLEITTDTSLHRPIFASNQAFASL